MQTGTRDLLPHLGAKTRNSMWSNRFELKTKEQSVTIDRRSDVGLRLLRTSIVSRARIRRMLPLLQFARLQVRSVQVHVVIGLILVSE